jgi:hypothetical protein
MTDSFQLNAGSALLVIGLGRSGLASLEVLARSDVRLFATDEKPPEALSEAISAAESFGAQFVEPLALHEILGRVDWAVLSPGVPPISPVVRAVHGANVPVIGEIELAYRLCKAPLGARSGRLPDANGFRCSLRMERFQDSSGKAIPLVYRGSNSHLYGLHFLCSDSPASSAACG